MLINIFKSKITIFPKNVIRVALSFVQTSLMSDLIEDSWIFISASALDLL